MPSRRFVVTLAVFAPLAAIAPAIAQGTDPADPVRKLYANFGVGGAAGKSGFSEKVATQLLTKSLLALYRKAVKAELDYDFFVQGNDFNLAKPIEIGAVVRVDDTATVAAILTQNVSDTGSKTRQKTYLFGFKLVQQDGRWRIDDATYKQTSLRREWQATIAASKP